ncbi:MAG: MFS transporter [Anaerolineae bacterium]
MGASTASLSDQERIQERTADLTRRNSWALGVDSALFTMGMSLISSTTVLPAFVAALTDSEMLVGVASGLSAGAWLLPQLVIASVVAHKSRLKPIIVTTALLSRPLFLLAGLAILFLGASHPALTLAIVLAIITIFFMADAVVSVPWFALLGKLIPATQRGRVIGGSQIVGGLGGIAAGAVVRYLLGEESAIAFPANFAILYMAASVVLIFSGIALAGVREPPAPVETEDPPTALEVLRALPKLIAEDRPFQRMQLVRILAGFVSLASSFYVLHATRELGLPMGSTGLFVSAQVAGTLAAGFATSLLQDRWGPLVHMRVVIVVACLAPTLGLIISSLAGALGSAALYPYLGLFFFLGIVSGSMSWPYFNWILEYADEARRPLYIGISNTLGALTMLAYPLGGWIVSALSYPAAFGVALAFGIAALLLSSRVPSVRMQSSSQA